MDANVKVEDTIEVPLPINPTCSVSDLNQVKDEWFSADLNTQVKHEDTTSQCLGLQLKSEAPDVKFGVTSGGHDINIKLEPLESEELQIKDETDQSPTDGTTEKSTQFEYFDYGLCNNKSTYKTNLQHMKIRTGEKLFKCSICDYRCSQKSRLSNHIKTHTKPFKCSICDYRCSQNSYLSTHIKTHTRNIPFKCSICDYKCIAKSSLSRHIKKHTGEKPFKCSICDCRFREKCNLSNHIKTHTAEKLLKCSICDYECTPKSSLTRHMKTHTREKPFKCKLCDYRTIQKCNLKQHMKTHV